MLRVIGITGHDDGRATLNARGAWKVEDDNVTSLELIQWHRWHPPTDYLAASLSTLRRP